MADEELQLINEHIGDFEVIEEIGHGAMATVFRAFSTTLERDVALKIPNQTYIQKAGFRARFTREATAMSRLSHRNIVRVLGVGEHNGVPFLSMEYVQGTSLSQLLSERGRMEIEETLEYLLQICQAVEYAHQRAIVHRDLKPSNILVESTGRVLVVDFGISKIMSGNTLEDTLTFIGTPLYMSPEQCGEGQLDHRTDIYSIGIIFYEMLIGKPPFAGNTPAEIIKNHLLEAPKFPRVNGQELPPKVVRILRKMLAKSPDDRYPDALALGQELSRYKKELRLASKKAAQEIPTTDTDDAEPLVVCYIPQKMLLGSISFALKNMKHRLVVTNTLHELLSVLSKTDAKLVVLSSYTGKGGVFELAGKVRGARHNPDLRILLLSHGISRTDVGKAFASGINDIVAEPFDPSIMVSKLENAILGQEKTVESRRHFRKAMSEKVTFKIDTDILDISEGGMRIATSLPLRVGEILTFELHIFKKLGLGEKSGRVVWVSKEDSGATFGIQAGIDFVNVTQNERERLRRWILSSTVTPFPAAEQRVGRKR